MSWYSIAEYENIVEKFDVQILNQLNPADFVDFGVVDSKIYYAKLEELMNRQGLNPVMKTWLFVFATAVKNKRRILMAMNKPVFRIQPWYTQVRQFIENNLCQYTHETDENRFAVVHIPSCAPFIASRAWLQISREPTVQSFLENLWAAQINLDGALMGRQMTWEQDFWQNVVLKGGNRFERQGFQQEYWNTKSQDKYLLLGPNGTLYGPPEVINRQRGYNEEEIRRWIESKVDHVAGAGPGGGPGPGGLGHPLHPAHLQVGPGVGQGGPPPAQPPQQAAGPAGAAALPAHAHPPPDQGDEPPQRRQRKE